MNPYLPLYEYIPDGEPHVFDGKAYIFGSHDRFDGEVFCQNDYIAYCADFDDLDHWHYCGVIYSKYQDPRNEGLEGLDAHYMWAPDVVKGNDGRYYLYYCLDVLPEIAVAVSDNPAGKYEFLGYVKHPDGTPLGLKEGDLIQFDPGVFIDDDKTIYLYSGNAPRTLADMSDDHRSQVMQLENDMLTLKTMPKLLMPIVGECDNNAFKGHEFFEASSIRKINSKYYFIYSDINSNSLSYAVSDYPDRDYEFKGQLIALGDTGYKNRKRDEARNFLGNTHGSIEYINGEWYVFYHRQTNRNLYSRQSCVEIIYFDENGNISQPEMTSLGFRKDSLAAKGNYSSAYACNLWGIDGIYEYVREKHPEDNYPYITQVGEDREMNELSYIANMQNGSCAGYKYFSFDEDTDIQIKVNGCGKGKMRIFAEREDLYDENNHMLNDLTDTHHPLLITEIDIDVKNEMSVFSGRIKGLRGRVALYFEYVGSGRIDFYEIGFGE